MIKNILFLAPNVDLEKPDAQSVHVIEITKALCDLGMNVHVVIKRSTNGSQQSSCINFKPIDYGAGLLGKLHSVLTIVWLVFYSTFVDRVDVIYIRQYLLAFIPAILAKIFRCPVFVEINGIYLDDQRMSGAYPAYVYKNAFCLSIHEWGLSKLLELLYRCSSGIIVVATGLIDYLNKTHGVSKQKIHLCRNGVNVEEIIPLDKECCRKRLGLRLERKYIGYVGSLVPWQGVDFYLKVFSKLVYDYENLDLIIVGTGEREKKLKNLVSNLSHQERIIFAGGVSHATALEYIGAFDFVIAPYTITFPRSVIMSASAIKIPESLAAGRPVIVSKLPGLEIIEEAGLGFLAVPDNLEDWITQTESALALNEQEYQEMSDRDREYAVEKLTWNNTASCICRTMQDIIQSR